MKLHKCFYCQNGIKSPDWLKKVFEIYFKKYECFNISLLSAF